MAKLLATQCCLRKSPVAAALLGWLAASVFAESPAAAQDALQGIAGNPGAVDVEPGTGELGRLIGFGPASGVRLGGVLVSNGNYLASGGNSPGVASFNNLLVTGLDADLEKLIHIPGATVGAALLQFDGEPTNQQAGVVAGYNSLPGARHSTAPNFTSSGGGNPCSRTPSLCGSESSFPLTISTMSYVLFPYRIRR
jgi:carbohydrate-selective porin OprB